jgi:hypothetical protein
MPIQSKLEKKVGRRAEASPLTPKRPHCFRKALHIRRNFLTDMIFPAGMLHITSTHHPSPHNFIQALMKILLNTGIKAASSHQSAQLSAFRVTPSGPLLSGTGAVGSS